MCLLLVRRRLCNERSRSSTPSTRRSCARRASRGAAAPKSISHRSTDRERDRDLFFVRSVLCMYDNSPATICLLLDVCTVFYCCRKLRSCMFVFLSLEFVPALFCIFCSCVPDSRLMTLISVRRSLALSPFVFSPQENSAVMVHQF